MRTPDVLHPPGRDGIRLVAIDLDGTLLNSSKQVSERTTLALRALPAQGVKVVIASARPPRSVRHIYRLLALDTVQINYNGALIWDEPARRVVFHRPMEPALVRQMIAYARAIHEPLLVTCEILDRWYTDREDQTYTTETGRLFKPDVIAPLESITANPVTKLLLLGAPDQVTLIESQLAAAFAEQVSVLRTDAEHIQIMEKHIGKSTALMEVARHYGVPLEQVMAIGDAPNDVGMLQLSGVAVAMDNAHPFVKNVADWIAPSNNDHGVHAALVKFGLCAG